MKIVDIDKVMGASHLGYALMLLMFVIPVGFLILWFLITLVGKIGLILIPILIGVWLYRNKIIFVEDDSE